jgi:hypothetical protein
MIGKEPHVTIREEYCDDPWASEFYQWLTITCRIEANRDVLLFLRADKEDAT